MTNHKGFRSLLLLLLILVVSFVENVKPQSRKNIKWSFVSMTQVKTCPEGLKPLKNVDKNKLLGTWYAYATTALDTPIYRRRCTSYNVENNPAFDTEIIFTDHKSIVITYTCTYNPTTELNDVKLRLLTRTRTPMSSVMLTVARFLHSISFPISKLVFLKSLAYCFEWYIYKFHQRPHPGNFNVPIDPFFVKG